MRTCSLSAVTLSLMLAVTSSVSAGMAVIETTAPLSDRSNEGVKAAIVTAVQNAVRGASAMGLSRIAVDAVQVLPQIVIVRVVATDSPATESEPNERDQDGTRPSGDRDRIEETPHGKPMQM